MTQAIIDAPVPQRDWQHLDGRVLRRDRRDAHEGRVQHVGVGADEESQQMRAFFERGTKATLDSLVKHFARTAH